MLGNNWKKVRICVRKKVEIICRLWYTISEPSSKVNSADSLFFTDSKGREFESERLGIDGRFGTDYAPYPYIVLQM